MPNILILDECSTSTMYKPLNYSDFINSEEDSVSLFLITNYASEADKLQCKMVIEINSPTSNGQLEIEAFRIHQLFKMDQIYTKQEDLILRASYLRQELKIEFGMRSEEAILFRDKYRMKKHLSEAGILCPPFERVFSPAHVLTFAQQNGYPCVIKPTLGSVSQGVRVIRDEADCSTYLKDEFYERINEKVMDYNGDLIIEKYVKGIMFHVNGHAKDKKIMRLWPFQYIQSNLGFTQGNYYGNLSISHKDVELYEQLKVTTQAILNALPCPRDLLFHLELFQDEKGQFLLCEIAARRPGGSIALLIDSLEGDNGKFPEMEFRLNIGLKPRLESVVDISSSSLWVGDILVPRRKGRLISIPSSIPFESPLDQEGAEVSIVPMAQVGSVYKGFNIGHLNTSCRIVCKIRGGGVQGGGLSTCKEKLLLALSYFEKNVRYEEEEGMLPLERSNMGRSAQ